MNSWLIFLARDSETNKLHLYDLAWDRPFCKLTKEEEPELRIGQFSDEEIASQNERIKKLFLTDWTDVTIQRDTSIVY